MKEEVKSYLTLSNLLKLAGYVAGGIVALILLVILLRQMIRVR
jgi:ribosome-associated protein YbcJ (S4-like RNA binding protein)